MKKQLFTYLSSTLFCLPCLSQISISAEDLYKVNEKHKFSMINIVDQIDGLDVDAGASGEHVNWDFSELKNIDSEQFEVQYITPGETPFGEVFKQSDLATGDSRRIDYFAINNEYFKNTGFALSQHGSELQPVKIEEPLIIMTLPLTYGQEKTSTSQQIVLNGPYEGVPGIDSIRQINFFKYHYQTDAYGMIKTPNGTFESIRLFNYNTTTALMEFYYTNEGWKPVFGYPQIISASSDHTWWTKDLGCELMMIRYSDTTGTNIKEIIWNQDEKVASNALAQSSQKLHIAPNPSNGLFSIRSDDSFVNFKDIVVFDASGNPVYSSAIVNQHRLDLSHLPNGLYSFRMRSDQGYYFDKFLVLK